MAFQPRPGSVSLFKNDRKTEDTHPDLTCYIVLEDGTEMQADLYKNTSQKGTTYYKGRMKPKWKPKARQDNTRHGPPVDENQRQLDVQDTPPEEDVPF